MKVDDLKKFCRNYKTPKLDLMTPFSWNGYAVATNGHVLIRIPAVPEVTRTENIPNVKEVFDKAPEPESWHEIPEPAPAEFHECPECGGKKWCQLCCGEGRLLEFEKGIAKTIKCEMCNGSGDFVTCEWCDGSGVEEVFRSTKIGAQTFQNKYLRILRTLPGVMIGPTTDLKCARFKFDGGDGLIMPTRE